MMSAMTVGRWPCLLAMVVAACGTTPPPPAAAPVAKTAAAPHDADSFPGGAEAIPPDPEPVLPSTASYEEAMAAPESLDNRDGRPELTDRQLSEPTRGVLDGCRVPSNVHLTIQAAVRNGHAIGVTIRVELPAPKPTKKPPKRLSAKAAKAAKAQAKADAALIDRITRCVDHAVRGLTWPPSSRRDSFTTTF